jgi:hypothetical protein
MAPVDEAGAVAFSGPEAPREARPEETLTAAATDCAADYWCRPRENTHLPASNDPPWLGLRDICAPAEIAY